MTPMEGGMMKRKWRRPIVKLGELVPAKSALNNNSKKNAKHKNIVKHKQNTNNNKNM